MDSEHVASFDYTVLRPSKEGLAFRCPVCQNVARNDAGMEPMCTGPNWTDDHPPALMIRIPV